MRADQVDWPSVECVVTSERARYGWRATAVATCRTTTWADAPRRTLVDLRVRSGLTRAGAERAAVRGLAHRLASLRRPLDTGHTTRVAA